MENAKRDDNNVPTLIAVSSADGATPIRLWADPTTHRLLVSSSMSTGGTVAGGTPGSVLFVGAGSTLAQDNANFFWDNANKRLGIGKTPTESVDVSGNVMADRLVLSGTAVTAPTLGIYASGSNELAFAYGGVRALRLVRSTNVMEMSTVMQIRSNQGTAGVPALSFVGDTNTGIWSPGTASVAIATGGTNRVTVSSAGTTTFAGSVVNQSTMRLMSYTVATLPAGTQGDMAYVTDATAPTYNGPLVGGGAVVVPVFYNGTAWTSH